MQLSIFPVGSSPTITPELGFERRGEQVVYFNGHLPVLTHEVADRASFRFFTARLIVNVMATQSQIAKAFAVPLTTVKRCCRKYRQGEAAVFSNHRRDGKGVGLCVDTRWRCSQCWIEDRGCPRSAAGTGLKLSADSSLGTESLEK